MHVLATTTRRCRYSILLERAEVEYLYLTLQVIGVLPKAKYTREFTFWEVKFLMNLAPEVMTVFLNLGTWLETKFIN